jgi:hypothetical protein
VISGVCLAIAHPTRSHLSQGDGMSFFTQFLPRIFQQEEHREASQAVEPSHDITHNVFLNRVEQESLNRITERRMHPRRSTMIVIPEEEASMGTSNLHCSRKSWKKTILLTTASLIAGLTSVHYLFRYIFEDRRIS